MNFCVYLAAWIAAADAVGPITIAAPDDPSRVVVRLKLDDAALRRLAAAPEPLDEATGRTLLTLSLVDDGGVADVPLLGDYRTVDGTLEFRPRFALMRGASYRAAAWVGSPPRAAATFDYRVPEPRFAEPATVVSVRPADERLPANVLKFYITFSRPMREGREVLERIRLFEADGPELGAPWRDLELWNAAATRLTLFIHPGRIKQGVNLRDDFGPVLHAGKTYELVVGADLRDAGGQPLGTAWRRRFTAEAEVRERIDVARWRLDPPRAETREPLVVRFERPLDYALTERCLTVQDAEGRPIAASVRPSDDAAHAFVTPSGPWPAAEVRLVVDPELEDCCGNTPLRAFDHDLTAPQVEVLPPMLRHSFRPR